MLAHMQARFVYRDTVDHRIGTRQINIFKNAGRKYGVVRTLARIEPVRHVDENRFARRYVTHDTETQCVERNRLRSHEILLAFRCIIFTNDQWANAERIAESQQTVTGDHNNDGIRPPATAMNTGYRTKDGFRIKLVAGSGCLQFVRQYVQQHFRIGIGIDVTQILKEHFLLQLLRVGQVAVMRQYQAKRRIYVKRLGFG